MYRAVSLAALRKNASWEDANRLAELARQCTVELDGKHVFLNGEDVSDEIRTTEVTLHIHYMADNPAVRERMVELQRAFAAGRDVVTEGRDQGTVAFPAAECKIFLTATARERAQRRMSELQDRGEAAKLEEVLEQQELRDQRDASRDVGRLAQATDAIELITDGMTPDEVLARLLAIVRGKLPSPEDGGSNHV